MHMTIALLLRVDALLDERLRAIGADLSPPYNPVLEFLRLIPSHLVKYETFGDGTVHVSTIMMRAVNFTFRMDGGSILYTTDEMNWTMIKMDQILSVLGVGKEASIIRNIFVQFAKKPRKIPFQPKPSSPLHSVPIVTARSSKKKKR